MQLTVIYRETMMKRASFLILISMFGGFSILSAQERDGGERERREEFAIARTLVPNGGSSFLGIVGEDVDDETVEKLNLPGEYGAVIMEIVRGSAAEDAGLRKYDVIVAYNGTRVESMAQLRRMIAETPVGRTVDLEVMRDGARQDVHAEMRPRYTELNLRSLEMGRNGFPEAEWQGSVFNDGNTTFLFPEGQWIAKEFGNGDISVFFPNTEEWMEGTAQGALPEDFDEKMQERMEKLQARLKELDIRLADSGIRMGLERANGNVWFEMNDDDDRNTYIEMADAFSTRMFFADGHRLGATVQPLSGQLAQFFKLDEGETGVLVYDVQEGMAAEKGGLEAGDVITRIDGENVEDPIDVTRIVSGGEGTVELDIVRDGRRMKLTVDLGRTNKLRWTPSGTEDESDE